MASQNSQSFQKPNNSNQFHGKESTNPESICTYVLLTDAVTKLRMFQLNKRSKTHLRLIGDTHSTNLFMLKDF